MTDEAAKALPPENKDAPKILDFSLVRRIGSGGFGEVWLAVNRTTGQLRAVKVIALRRSDVSDPAGREIASITRLEANVRRRHPNLLDIHHVGQTDQYLFYVMDLADDVSGKPASSDASYRPATLQRRLERGPLPPQECWDYARQLLEGLASLHEAGMVHRDVKPANCLFVEGELKLADFGLLTEGDPHVSRLGTVKYMPPDGTMDVRADVYAAGLVIYEMVTGLPVDRFPHLGTTSNENLTTPALGSLLRLIAATCQPDPRLRPRDARALLDEFMPPGAEEVAVPVRSGRRIFATVAVAALLMTLAAAVGYWAARPPRVHVNFTTYPFEATVFLDGVQQFETDGTPCKTPCTIDDLPARKHHVVFKHAGIPDLYAGQIDLARAREVVVHWGSQR